VPNLVVMAPADEDELRRMLTTAYQHPGPAAVRYPRGTGVGVAIDSALRPLPIGRGEVVRDGARVAILAFGTLLAAAREVADALGATLVNMRFVKPLDTALVRQLALRHELLVSVEENVVAGGAGAAVLEFLAAAGLDCEVVVLGIPDRFIGHGDTARQLAQCGLDAAGIRAAIEQRLGTTRARARARP
jgi:1-deoxy-D-xylulose-5-phosphate synthase